MVHKVLQVAYHRNGIGGDPFHCVIFDHTHEVCTLCNDEIGWQSPGSGKPMTCFKNCGAPSKQTKGKLK